MKTIKISLVAALLFTLHAHRDANAFTFGSIPYHYVDLVAGQYEGRCGLTKEMLIAYLLAPTWGESAGNFAISPSPMTLDRGLADDGPDLRPPGQEASGAFWHPGIGTWQLDDSGLGSAAGVERFDSLEAVRVVANEIVTRYCHDKSAANVWGPWDACYDRNGRRHNRDACVPIFQSVMSALTHGSLPMEQVDEYGGGVPHTCLIAGQTVPCIYVDARNAQPIGETWWTSTSLKHALPLSAPFYAFHVLDPASNTEYEWRYWLAADNPAHEDFVARRANKQNSRFSLCWASSGHLGDQSGCNLPQSSIGLCVVDQGRGACSGATPLAVSLLAAPNSGPAPLRDVTLIASVTGDPNESINYTFYCNRADSGTDIRTGWIGKYDGVLRHRVTLTSVCNYPSDGVYAAKVIVEQGNGAAESRAPITVGNGAACFPLTLTANSPSGGNVPAASPAESSGCAPGQYIAGESIQLTAAPASGWSVGSWIGTQNDSSTSPTNNLLMPAASHTVIVNYVPTAPGPLTILTSSLPDAAPNQPYSAQLDASGGAGTGYSWSLQAGFLPLGLTLNAQSGVISGTPTQAGTLSNFTIAVRDSGTNSTSRRFSLYVQPVAGPTIVSSGPSDFVFYVGTPYARTNSITYLVQSGQPPFDWSASGLPPGLQIDSAGGFLYGTPTTPGNFPGRISASDSIGEHASLPVVLQVSTTSLIFTDSSGHTPPNPPPGQIGQSYQFFIEAAGGSQTGFQWSVQGNLPPGLVSQNGPGCPTYCALELVGTPTLAGTYRFTVTVTDSLNNHASLAVTIIVNSGTPPMITTTQLPTATIGSAYSTGLSATGGTPPYRWSFSGSAPDPGIQLSQDGTLSGITQNTNDCPTGSSDHLGGIWVGQGYPSTYFQVLVTDAIGQSNSKQLCLVSYYPRPQVSSDTPSSITIDGQNHTITLNGSNFRSTSYIIMNGAALPPTTYIGPNALSFTFYPKNGAAFCADPNGIGSACVDAGNVMQSVIEPYSNISLTSASLAVYNPPPTVTSVAAVLDNTNQPCTANQLCQLIVTGGGFSFRSDTSFLIAEANLSLTAAVVPSSPPPWSQIITSAFSLPSGTYTLQVTNNHQAGGSNVTVSGSFQVN